MDELEISGKRYISSRRAGKENKYHADYIGQLIRAKKVAGQKVGRAWYVDAESLAEYLGKEAQPQPVRARVISAVKAPVVEAMVEEIEEVEDEVVITEVAVDTVVEEEAEVQEDSTPMIYRTTREAREARPGLRYIADEGPLLPQVQKQQQTKPKQQLQPQSLLQETYEEAVPIRRVATMPIMPKIAQRFEAAPIVESPVYPAVTTPAVTPTQKQKRSLPFIVSRGATMLALGAVVFGVALLLSTHLFFTVTLDGEQSASVGYSVK